MKTIRQNVFETNSSSTHSMTIMDVYDYERWKKEEDSCYDENNRKIISLDQRRAMIVKDIIDYRKKYHPDKLLDFVTDDDVNDWLNDNFYDYPLTYSEYINDYQSDLEIDINHYTTQSNDKIVIICKYGNDY